jgi:hypothetical protein
MRTHMTSVERLFLVEHNLVNPKAVDLFIRGLVTRCKPDAGKMWLQKKLRSLIMNDTDYLIALSPAELSVMRGLPDYLTQAVERGDTVYQFAPVGDSLTATRTLSQVMSHVIDWFNSLAVVAARKATSPIDVEDKVVAQKWLEKLPKIPVNDITAIADAWFAKMGTRIAAEKLGVETIHRWENGFYAVRYTDLATMQSDGRDLQNCLQNGTYWDAVKRGTNVVYGIRKPNDEAVVGIRAAMGRGDRPQLEECKGKNNKPVAPIYVPYVIDFLTVTGFVIKNEYDLKAAGIEVHDGKLGRFEDIAPVSYDQDGIKIWQTKSRFVAATQGGRIEGTIINQTLAALSMRDANGAAIDFTPDMLTLLNILKLPSDAWMGDHLAKQGIFYHDGRYGDARTVGKPAFAVDGYAGYQVTMSTSAQTAYSQIMVFATGKAGDDAAPADAWEPVGHLVVDGKNHLTQVSGKLFDTAMNDPLLRILNALDLPPSLDLEPTLQSYQIFFDQVRYGRLAALGKPDIAVGPMQLLRLGRRQVWIMRSTKQHGEARFSLKGKTLIQGSQPARLFSRPYQEPAWMGSAEANDAVRQLALKYKAKAVEDAELFGMVNTKAGLVADFPSFLAVAGKTQGMAYYGQTTDPHPPQAQPLIRAAEVMFADRLDAAQQKALYATLKPDDGGITASTSETDTIYDITVPHISIELASANHRMVAARAITEKAVIAAIQRDTTAAIQMARRLVASHPHGFIHIKRMLSTTHLTATLSEGNRTALEALYQQAQTLHSATDAAIRVRRADPDKYATDLSSRFAAMNAFRKR